MTVARASSPPLPELGAVGLPDAPEEGEWFEALAQALADEGVEEELCKVGGAVLRLVFRSRPGTRRPSRLFGDVAAAKRAEEEVARRFDLPPGWVDAAVRRLVADDTTLFDTPQLRVFAPPPDYLLAMKCAALRFAPDSNTDSDLRYLLMYLGVSSPEQAMRVVDRYLSPQHRPADLADRVAALLP